MSRRLENKVAIVSGAASGIGFATAERFGREGAHVVAVDIDKEQLTRFKSLPGLAHMVTAAAVNVAEPAEVHALVAQTLATHGHIDILVNCAAVFDMTPLKDASAETIKKSRQVNVLGTKTFIDEVSRSMIDQSVQGSIVNVASVSGMGVEPIETVYSSTKAEIIALGTAAAVRLGKFGIRVNTVSPGPILTEASYKHMEQIGVDKETFIGGAKTTTITGRMGKPDEVASAITFLASDEASYITGSNLVVDGGFRALLAARQSEHTV